MQSRNDNRPASFVRRSLLGGGGLALVALWTRLKLPGLREARAGDAPSFEVVHSDAEWRALLSPEQYRVLRREGTELAFSSPLDHEKRRGTYACAGCGLDLF